MSEELKPCPWQKEGELHVPIVLEAMGEAWVRCTCDVAGPMCATKEQAIERWNARHERTCHRVNSFEAFGIKDGGEDFDACSLCARKLYVEDDFCSGCGAKVVGE